MIDAEAWREKCKTKIVAGYSPGGQRGDTYDSGQELAESLHDWGVWKPGDVLVDVGCGNGRLAMGLLTSGVAYVGIDIIEPCIQFCREAFAGLDNFRFIHLDVYNARYWNGGLILPGEVVYPLDNACADVVVANSLFSHTGQLDVAKRNLSEMRRILKPGGKLYTTWFFGNTPDPEPAKTIYRRVDIEPLMKWADVVREGLTAYSRQVALLAVKRD